MDSFFLFWWEFHSVRKLSNLEQIASCFGSAINTELSLTRKYFRRYVVTVRAKFCRKWLRRDGNQIVNVSRGKRLTLPDKLEAGFVVDAIDWIVGQAVAVYHCARVT